jgi:hypothetical protein
MTSMKIEINNENIEEIFNLSKEFYLFYLNNDFNEINFNFLNNIINKINIIIPGINIIFNKI